MHVLMRCSTALPSVYSAIIPCGVLEAVPDASVTRAYTGAHVQNENVLEQVKIVLSSIDRISSIFLPYIIYILHFSDVHSKRGALHNFVVMMSGFKGVWKAGPLRFLFLFFIFPLSFSMRSFFVRCVENRPPSERVPMTPVEFRRWTFGGVIGTVCGFVIIIRLTYLSAGGCGCGYWGQ
jgi:hypothetical protein